MSAENPIENVHPNPNEGYQSDVPITRLHQHVDHLDPSRAHSQMLHDKKGTNDPRRDWGLNNDESANRLLARMNKKVDKMTEGQNQLNYKKLVSKKVYM